jgi:hypothetical protein
LRTNQSQEAKAVTRSLRGRRDRPPPPIPLKPRASVQHKPHVHVVRQQRGLRAAKGQEGNPTMGQAQPKRRTALIVEDDADLRSLTAALLEEEQLDTIECESAEAALAV